MYVIMYGVKRTTVFLPDELKAELKRVAEADGCSEAELIREGVRLVIEERKLRPKPDFPLFSYGGFNAARDEEMLAGDPERGIPAFGED